MKAYRTINHPHPHVDGLDKVTGKLQFMSDIRLPNMLWGKVLRSTAAHARIIKIDIDEALKVPGVKAVITAEDIDHPPLGPFIPDWQILARDKVIYKGQEVVAVAATTPRAAAEAIELIDVEYELLPPIFDTEAAMEKGAPLVYENRKDNIAFTFSVEQGDPEQGFLESEFVREEVFHTHGAFHAYLEPNGSLASYEINNDSCTIWAATQVPYKAQLLYAQGLRLSAERLRLIQVPMGGAFGGKFECNLHLVCAHLSRKARQPVRLVNTMAEEFETAPIRVPMSIRLKMGIKADGTIMAKDVTVIADNGARTNYGPAVTATACFRVDSLYRIPNVRALGHLVYTNNLPKGCMRGFGNPQMLFAVEGMLDMLAEDAGLTPQAIRLKNAYKNGEISIHGWEIGSCGLSECIKKAISASEWNAKKSKKIKTGSKVRGLGLGCCNHVSGYRPTFTDFDGSSARVLLSATGSITVYSGEVDMGQGYKTVLAQSVAEILGVPLGWVQVAAVDSLNMTLGIGSLASRGTVMGCNAACLAALEAREKLLTGLAELLNKEKAVLDIVDGKIIWGPEKEMSVPFHEMVQKLANTRAGGAIVGAGQYVPNTVNPDPVTKYGNPSPTYSFAAHVAEVEVDLETGQVEVVNYTAANDVGKAINPLLCQGQIEGGAVQGMGWALTEQLHIREGKLVNPNLLDYKIPSFADSFSITSLLVEEEDSNGPFGAKSLGEPAFNPVAAAICNAVYDAVGVRITSLPVKPEELLSAIKTKKENRLKSAPANEKE